VTTSTEQYADFWALWKGGEWERETREWVERVTRPGDLFVDVGAWIGPVTLWAVEAGAYVIAIEPDRVACRELRRATEHVPGRVEVWEGALVAAAAEDLVMLAPNPKAGGEWGDSQSLIAPELSTAIEVLGFTLEAVLQGRTPTQLKMDVEGYEERLAPAILPYLASVGAWVQVSLHGTPLPEQTGKWASMRWQPDERWGDWQFEPARRRAT
jgi:FkbM family methyltransferase